MPHELVRTPTSWGAVWSHRVVGKLKTTYWICDDCCATHRNWRPKDGCVLCKCQNLIESDTSTIPGKMPRICQCKGCGDWVPAAEFPDHFCERSEAMAQLAAGVKKTPIKKGVPTKGLVPVKKGLTTKKTVKKATNPSKNGEPGDPCHCGCGLATKSPGRRFLQGHDSRFKGYVTKIRAGKMKLSEAPAAAQTHIRRYMSDNPA